MLLFNSFLLLESAIEHAKELNVDCLLGIIVLTSVGLEIIAEFDHVLVLGISQEIL